MNKLTIRLFASVLALVLLALPKVAGADFKCDQLFKSQTAGLSEFLSRGEVDKISQIVRIKAGTTRNDKAKTYFRGLSRIHLEAFETSSNKITSLHGDTTWVTTSFEMALSYALPIASYHFQNNSSYSSIVLALEVPRSILLDNNGITASISIRSLPGQDLASVIGRVGVITVTSAQVAEARATFPKITELSKLKKWVKTNRTVKSGEKLFLFDDMPLNSELNYNELFDQFFQFYLTEKIAAGDPGFIRWIDIP